ncbi:MBL fold metallo-hydrolase [Alphaproteobacteria bacterium GH1-50]|uniref:MBL fold metallo-hydrolase n=1 Tax=Kangsaoukella pontilimi TaxID=2691042 RepID=A0A7C9MBQ0_9RHOB|nr:MBL fold metallo-hydrolase [Kangsaoukella pontilimi]MXQ06592.1 MBL fold metallo-hydrolase [Kangsaoukella pontilimi]
MPFSTDKSYFIARPDVVLKSAPGGGSARNHLILGDWLRYLGDTDGEFIRIRCRGDEGWVHEDDVTETRALEINFVDIGQGDGCHIVTPDDEIILIDAGVGTNMERFLSWRYNLRSRNVRRAPDFDPAKPEREPWKIDYVVVSHPDNDHYLGFRQVFDNPKLSFDKVFHNGIVERPDEPEDPALSYPDDLGGYVDGSPKMLWDVAHTNKRLKEIVNAFPDTRKQLISTYRACLANTKTATFRSLGRKRSQLENGTRVFFDKFDGTGSPLAFEVLGPIYEPVTHDGQTRDGLRKLGAEGVTKNGHSVILKLTYGKLAVMLGGDLNTQAQDFLLSLYAGGPKKTSSLEKKIAGFEAEGNQITAEDQAKLDRDRAKLDGIIQTARQTFQVDVAKACHHGSSHIMDAFLAALNPVVTVISSGDEESHSHPRPDALGTFGKHGRGRRPLIFSTELARSTREFTPVINYLNILRAFEARLEAEADPDKRREIEQDMQEKKDRNVAVYGMITLRALGDTILLAQKLEEPRSEGEKWDLYELHHNDKTGMYEYDPH